MKPPVKATTPVAGDEIVPVDLETGRITNKQNFEEEFWKLAAVVENSADFIALASPTNQIVYMNPSGLRLVGLPHLSDAKAHSLRELHTPSDTAKFESEVTPSLAAKSIWKGELKLRHFKDGGEIPVIYTIFTIRDPNSGNPIATAAIAHDIRERIKAEDEVRQSESFLQSIIENIPDMIFVKNATDLRFCRINKAGEELVGVSRESMLGKNDFDLFPPSEAEFFTKRDREVLENGELVDISREPIHTLDKGLRVLHTKKIPIRRPDGSPQYLLGISEDITDRIKAEDNVRQFTHLLNATSDFVAIYDPSGKPLYLNEAAKQMLALPEKVDLNTLRLDKFHPEWAVEILRNTAIPHALFAGSWSGEVAIRDFHGREVPVSQVIIAHRSDDGTVTQISTIIRDISERIRIERQLITARESALEASRLKSEFLASISHEIRTPMTAIVGLGSLLKEGNLSPHERGYVDTILNSANALLTLLNDVLQLSKLEAGKIDMQMIDFSLTSLLDGVHDMFAHGARQKGLSFVTRIDAESPLWLKGDPGRLRQVLINLVGNAIKFTDRGEVRVEATSEKLDDEHVKFRLTVSDSGIGIPEQSRPLLFKAFSQIQPNSQNGTGLGLSISKQIVDSLGGEIDFSSVPNQGTKFWFAVTLQIGLERKNPTAVPSPHVVTRTSARPQILVADDNVINQEVILAMLSAVGCEATAVSNGKQAVELATKAHFDLVLMDCQMPVMDGFMATRAIRQQMPDTKKLAIVALTAKAMGDVRIDCLDAGMDDYLSKPVDIATLSSVLAKWIPEFKMTAKRETVSPPPAQLAIDERTIRQLGKINVARPGFVGDLIQLFLKETPKHIERLRDSLRSGNYNAVVESAHLLKSSAGDLGAFNLMEVFSQLEKMGSTRNLARGNELLVQLDAEYLKVQHELRGFLNEEKKAA